MACKYTMLRTTPEILTFSWLIIFFMLHIPTLVQICYSLAPDQCTTHTHDSNKDLHIHLGLLISVLWIISGIKDFADRTVHFLVVIMRFESVFDKYQLNYEDI